MRQGKWFGRKASIVMFACLVLLGTAVPVMADPSEPEPEPPAAGEPVLQASEYSHPDAASITAAHQIYARKAEERERELEEQPFVAERESSRDAYVHYTPSQAEELFLSTFGETFARLNAEPARLLSDAKLDENLGHGSAVITDEGKTEILEAGMPVEAENAEGETEKVDLTLERGPEGFEPENPVTEVSIGATAEEGIEVGDEGLTVTQVGAEESQGRLLGDKNVFFGEVEEGSQTDLIVSPTGHGVELFDLLRSIESPETLRFDVEVPAGDTMKIGAAGEAQILDPEGTMVGMVAKPHAEDAQGSYVPVQMEVEGDALVLHTNHREEDLAYPILVDPELVTQFWYGWAEGASTQAYQHWQWSTNTSLGARYEGWQVGWLGGLGVLMKSGSLENGADTEFLLSTANTNVYLENVTLWPYDRFESGCEHVAEPYDYEGYWDPVGNGWVSVSLDDAHNFGSTYHPGIAAQEYVFGLGVDEPMYNPCWRELMAGGASLQVGDWVVPSMVSATSSVPSGWITGSTQFSISMKATDTGLGVKEFSVTPDAEHNPGLPVTKAVGCVGNYDSPCPPAYEHAYSFSGTDFPKGEDNLSVTVRSPTNKVSGNPIPLTIKVDPEPPEVNLNGQLMAAVQEGQGRTGEKQGEGGPELTQPVYNLGIEAKDGAEGTKEAKLKRSGVKEVEVTVTDAAGTKVESTKAFPNPKSPCSEGSCEEKVTYPIPMTGLTAGKHHIIVKASDFAGNKAPPIEKEFEYLPATGLTEEDVTQRFLLPDGRNHGEGSYQGPELAVNVMNGNVVYHQRDVEVEGPNTNLEADLFYNSQLPKEESSEFGRGWTLSQTPTLKNSGSGSTATALMSTSALAGGVDLPQESGQGHFSDKLNAYIEKTPGGGYAVSADGGAETPATIYDAAGKVTEVQTSPTASVQYAYSGGHLAEIAVDDPGSTTLAPPPTKKAPSIVPVYVSSFGSAGTGNGQLSHPADVALDSKGNEWVADSANNRVEEFTPGGEFIKVYAPGGGISFSTPKSLAFDASGDLWVDDSGNSRLLEFSPAGTLMRTVGTNGSGTNQFNRPEGIAIAPSGHIWVADTYNYRIVELSAAGEWIKVVNPSGLGAIEPTGIDVGPEGNAWVADWAHNRVVELGGSGGLIRSVGTEGTGEGQFRNPDAIAVGALGEVWVGDQNNERVQELTKEGKYVTQFGSAGAGPGQFSLSYPMGIATDNEGSLFVTDTNDNRVEHWQVPHYGYKAVFAASFGSSGGGAGQYRHPSGLAVDEHGNVWILDTENNRLQELNRKGEFVRQLGSVGTGNGQFQSPKSIAFTNDGEFWVADAGNNRLEEFTEKGEFIKAVGSLGSGNGQFNGPEGIAIAPNGHIWVADTYNYRIVELDESGSFIRSLQPQGFGRFEPTGIAFGPGGEAWIADWADNQVVVMNPSGEIVRQFGSAGSGNGQFAHPDTVAVDPRGIVYVVDQNNRRVQVFNQTGEYLSQFGSSGSGAGQFSFAYPTGVAADGRGDIWVSDNNNRIQKWLTGSWVPAEEETIPTHDDPSVAMTTSSGLVTSMVSAQAGSHHYGHSNELLTSDEGPEGTTLYEYEPTTQWLKKITLPNGTTAAIEYEPTTGQAKTVTVDPAGTPGPKWTRFEYVQEIAKTAAENHEVPLGSREVIVEPETGARTFYAIDAAGDVVKSWNVEVAPVIFGESGNLAQPHNEKQIEANNTQELFINAYAPEGVRTIQFIVNGTTIVDEKTCAGTAKECEHETLQWIVEPEDLPIGTMWIDVVITSRVEVNGEPRKSDTRWWVTVPYVAPPEPGIPQPPKYKRVLEFREARGLDLDLNPIADELALHSRIWETIDAWWLPSTPAGQVAKATWERWGMPLRYVDQQELEYREAYVAHDVPLIEQWAKSHYPSTFAGVYLDERAGGLLRVGFTSEQAASEAALTNVGGPTLIAPGRVAPFTVAPSRSLATLEATQQAVEADSENFPEGLIVSYGIDVASNTVSVGATNVAEAESLLRGSLGSGAPITVIHSEELRLTAKWENESGPILGGEYVRSGHGGKCSAGLGALSDQGPGPRRYFLLSAAHCGNLGDTYRRFAASGVGTPIGKVVRTGWAPKSGPVADGEAIEVHVASGAPTSIDLGSEGTMTVLGSEPPPPRGHWLCHSGAGSEMRLCGPVVPRKVVDSKGNGQKGKLVCYEAEGAEGNSGAPVWIDGTHTVVGLESGGLEPIPGKEGFNRLSCLTPLYPSSGRPLNEGILTSEAMTPIHLRTFNGG